MHRLVFETDTFRIVVQQCDHEASTVLRYKYRSNKSEFLHLIERDVTAPLLDVSKIRR